MHFSVPPTPKTHSFPAQFLQKSIKGLAKSSLRQRSHSGMQAPGVAASNYPVEERQ